MQTLRHARFLARLVLAWFVLAIGVAVAAPLVQPQALELVCSTAGTVKLVHLGDDGGTPAAHPHTLDCPLCMVGGAPPPVLAQLAIQPQPLERHSPQARDLHVAVRSAAPLPPRGPPALS